MRNSLVEEALKKTVHPEILVNMISKRVRQLGQGFRPLIAVGPKMTFMDVALKEIADGKLSYEVVEDPKDAAAGKKSKKKSA
ncbi:MAG: DNA-directed RNA polymerase subunit omega [bacterium]